MSQTRPSRSAPSSTVYLRLPPLPEHVAVARQAIAALARAHALPADATDCMRLAVTEACANVVRHAYADADEGALELCAHADGDEVSVVVSDTGRGTGDSLDREGPGLGLGLIAALSQSLHVERDPNRGSRLEMRFDPSCTMELA